MHFSSLYAVTMIVTVGSASPQRTGLPNRAAKRVTRAGYRTYTYVSSRQHDQNRITTNTIRSFSSPAGMRGLWCNNALNTIRFYIGSSEAAPQCESRAGGLITVECHSAPVATDWISQSNSVIRLAKLPLVRDCQQRLGAKR